MKRILFLQILFSILFYSTNAQNIQCNNWLSTPTTPSSVNLGDLDIAGNQMTIEAVIYQTTPNPDFGGDIVGKYTSPLNDNYLLRPNYCSITTSDGFFQTPTICPIKSNQNYHVAMVYDGSTLKFYRDGFLMSQINASGSLFQNSHNARIGYYALQDYNSQFFGYINEVRIWNTVRTQAQLRSSMFTTLANPTTQTGLLGYYTFDNLLNKQGNTLYNGTLAGSGSINAANPNCVFVIDSCFTSPIACNNWLSTPTNPSAVNVGDLDIAGNQMTIEAVIYQTTPNPDFGGDIVGKYTSPLNDNYLLRPNYCSITTSDGFFQTPTICPIKSNQNYHVAMVYDGSTLKFYRDGFLMSQINASGSLFQNSHNARIGYYALQDYNSQFFGYINEVRIWNTVRTQAQLRSSMFTTLANPTTQTGLLGYYTFDNLLNKQGNTLYNGTLAGSGSINAANPNCVFVIDSCFTSPIACNNWLSTPTNPSAVNVGDLDIAGNQMTIEAVIYQTTPNPDFGGDIVGKYTSPLNDNYLLRPNYCAITTSDGYFQTPSICPIKSNQNYHVAMVYDGSTLKFYRDGILSSQVKASGTLFQNNHNTRIGYYALQDYNSQFFGYINEVRIWNTARTRDQLTTYMFNSLPTPATQTGLLAYYAFDNLLNKQGNTLYNGTLAGSGSINAANPNCVFVIDSCLTSPIVCNNWLSTPTNPSAVNVGDLDIAGNQMTIEAVIYQTTPNPDFGGDIVGKYTSPLNDNYLLRPNYCSITTSDGYFQTPSICPIKSNQNYHVAMVYDGSTLKFYRDGILSSQVKASGTLFQNNHNTRIGYYALQDYNSQFFGYINEVRIWNTARTRDQLTTYMFNSLPTPATQTGLLAYYAFDNLLNKQGNTLYNGTLAGSGSINAANPNCVFVIDSCLTSPIVCNNWLSTSSKPSAVNIGDLDIAGNQMTIEAVIYQTSPNLLYDGDIVAKHTSPSNDNYLLRPNYCSITTSDGYFRTPPICPIASYQNYHVAMVYDGSTLKFYRNGFLMSQINATGSLFQNNIDARIGYYALQDYDSQFLGFINEVSIWNTARTQAQLRNSMFNSLPNPTAQTGLLGYYVFDNLLNKQGNATYNGVLAGSSFINATNPICTFLADTCLIAPAITITKFTASVITGKQILLNWHAEGESGITNYIIQRSTFPTSGFSPIGNIIPNNNSLGNDYTFTDKSVKPDLVYYYRLQIIEKSGNTKYSEIKSAKIISSESHVTIHPNPTKDLVYLTLNNFKGIVTLSLLNSIGHVILTKQVNAINNIQTTIDIRHLKKGNYYLVIQDDQGKIVKKIVKL